MSVIGGVLGGWILFSLVIFGRVWVQQKPNSDQLVPYLGFALGSSLCPCLIIAVMAVFFYELVVTFKSEVPFLTQFVRVRSEEVLFRNKGYALGVAIWHKLLWEEELKHAATIEPENKFYQREAARLLELKRKIEKWGTDRDVVATAERLMGRRAAANSQ